MDSETRDSLNSLRVDIREVCKKLDENTKLLAAFTLQSSLETQRIGLMSVELSKRINHHEDKHKAAKKWWLTIAGAALIGMIGTIVQWIRIKINGGP